MFESLRNVSSEMRSALAASMLLAGAAAPSLTSSTAEAAEPPSSGLIKTNTTLLKEAYFYPGYASPEMAVRPWDGCQTGSDASGSYAIPANNVTTPAMPTQFMGVKAMVMLDTRIPNEVQTLDGHNFQGRLQTDEDFKWSAMEGKCVAETPMVTIGDPKSKNYYELVQTDSALGGLVKQYQLTIYADAPVELPANTTYRVSVRKFGDAPGQGAVYVSFKKDPKPTDPNDVVLGYMLGYESIESRWNRPVGFLCNDLLLDNASLEVAPTLTYALADGKLTVSTAEPVKSEWSLIRSSDLSYPGGEEVCKFTSTNNTYTEDVKGDSGVFWLKK